MYASWTRQIFYCLYKPSNLTLFSTNSLVFSCKKKTRKNYTYQQVSNIYLQLEIFSTLEQLFSFHKFQECWGDFVQVVGVSDVSIQSWLSVHAKGRWRRMDVQKLPCRSVVTGVHGFFKPFRITCQLIWAGSAWCERHFRWPKISYK